MVEYKQSSRKFHDAWAAILYVLYSLFMLTVVIMISENPDYGMLISKINPKVLMFSTIFIVIQYMVLLLCLLYCAATFMHISCIALPVLSIVMAFIGGNVVGIVMACLFGFMALALYFFVYMKRIKYAAIITQKAVQVVSNNFLTIFAGFLISNVAYTVLNYILFTVMLTHKDENYESNFFVFAVALFAFWNAFTIIYGMRVFISSTVALHYLVEGAGKFGQAITNTLYASGSVCFGALLIAIVSALRLLVSQNQQDARRRGESAIMAVILGFILDVLRDFIDYSNQWAFSYIALTGESYLKATKGSWSTLMRGGNKIISSYLAEQVLGLISFIFACLYGYGLYYMTIKNTSTFDDLVKDKQKVLSLIFLVICYININTFMYAIYESAVKAMLFTHALFPIEVKKKDPEFISKLETESAKIL